MIKIVFFGTPEFVIPVAQSLLNIKNQTDSFSLTSLDKQSYQLSAVITNPDRRVGRKQILTSSPIKSWAQKKNLKIIDSALMIYIIKAVKELKPDLGILAAYGKIIPREIINLFPQGIWVIHPSLLPKYRGASPVQATILNGDQETGVSIIQMDEKMDHGPVICQFKEKILADDTAEILIKRLFAKTAEILPELLFDNLEIFSPPKPQNHSLATFTKLLTKDDGKIDWSWPAEKIERFVRAMTAWPGAWTEIEIPQEYSSNAVRSSRSARTIKRLKILKAHLENGKLVLDEVQLEGKTPVAWNDFQKTHSEVKFI